MLMIVCPFIITSSSTSQVMRVYYDRLVDDTDKSWLYNYLREISPKHLGDDFNVLFQHLDFDKDGKVRIYFCLILKANVIVCKI